MHQIKYGKGPRESIFELEIMARRINEEIKWDSKKLHMEYVEISDEKSRSDIELCADEHLCAKLFAKIGSYNILELGK